MVPDDPYLFGDLYATAGGARPVMKVTSVVVLIIIYPESLIYNSNAILSSGRLTLRADISRRGSPATTG